MSFYVHLYICVLLLYQITPAFTFTLPFNNFSSRVIPRRPTNSTVKPVNCLPNVSTEPVCDLRSASKLQGSYLSATDAEVIKPLSINGANNTPFFIENTHVVPKKSTVSSSDVTTLLSTLPKSVSNPSMALAPYISHRQSENMLKAPIPMLDSEPFLPRMILAPSCFDPSNQNVGFLNNLSMLPKIAPVNSECTTTFPEVPTTTQLPLVLNKTPPLSLNQDNNMFPISNNDLVKPLPAQDAIYYKKLPKMSVPIPAYNSAKTDNCGNRLDLTINSAVNEHNKIYLTNSLTTTPINQLVTSLKPTSLDININPLVSSTGNKMGPQVLPSLASETLPTKNTGQGFILNNFASNEIKNTNKFDSSNVNHHSSPVPPNLMNTNTQIPQIMSTDTFTQNSQSCLANLNQALNSFLINPIPFTTIDTSSTIDLFDSLPAQPVPPITKVSLPLIDGKLSKSNIAPKIIPESLNLKILPISTGQPIQGVVRPLLKNNTKCNSTPDLSNIAPSTQTKQSVENSIVSCNSMNQILSPYDNCDYKPLLNSLTQPSLIKINDTSSISPKDLTVVPQYSCIANSNLNQALNTFLTNQIPFTNKNNSSIIDLFESFPAQPTPSITKVNLPFNDGNLSKSNIVPRINPESLNLKILPISTGQPIQGVVRPLLKNNTKCNSTPDLLNIAPSTQAKQSLENSIVSCNSMNQILSPYDNCDYKPLLNFLTQPSLTQVPCLQSMPPLNPPQAPDLLIDFKSPKSFPVHSSISELPRPLPKNTCPITTNTYEPKTFSCEHILNTDSRPINIIPKLTTVDLTVTPPLFNGSPKNTFDNYPGILLPIAAPPVNSNIVSTISCDENINLEKTLFFPSGLPNLAPISPILDISTKPSINYDSSLKLSPSDTSPQLPVLNFPITSTAIPLMSAKNTVTSMCLPSNMPLFTSNIQNVNLPPQTECTLTSPYGIMSPQVPCDITDHILKTSPENYFGLLENMVPFHQNQLTDTFLPVSHLPTDVIKPKPFSVTSELPSLNSAPKNSDLYDINKICLNNSGYNVFSNLPHINFPTSPSYLPNYCVPSEDVNIANKNVIVANQLPKSLNTPTGPLTDVDVSKIATLLQKPFLKVPSLCNNQPATTPSLPIKLNLLPPILPSDQNSNCIDAQLPNVLFSDIDPTVYSCVQTGINQLIPISICTPKALPVPTCAIYPEITLPSSLPQNDYQQLTKPISEVDISNILSLQSIKLNDSDFLTTGTAIPLTNAISSVCSQKSLPGKGNSSNQNISSIELIPIGNMLQSVEICPRNTHKINLQKSKDKKSSLDETLKLNTPLDLLDVSYFTPNTVSCFSLENIVVPVNNIELSNPKSFSQNPFNLQQPLSIVEILEPTSTLHPNSGVFVDVLLPVEPESLSTLPNSYLLENPICILQDTSFFPQAYIPILSDLSAVPLTETIISPIKIEPPKSTDHTNLSTLNNLTTKLTNACLASAISNLTSSYVKRTIPEVHEIPKVTISKVKPKTKSKKRKPARRISKGRKYKNSNKMLGCASSDIPVYVDDEAKLNETDHDQESRVDNISEFTDDTVDSENLLEDCGVDIESVLSSILSNFKENPSKSLNDLILISNDKKIHCNTLEELAEYIVLKELVNSNLDSNWDLLEKIVDILCVD